MQQPYYYIKIFLLTAFETRGSFRLAQYKTTTHLKNGDMANENYCHSKPERRRG